MYLKVSKQIVTPKGVVAPDFCGALPNGHLYGKGITVNGDCVWSWSAQTGPVLLADGFTLRALSPEGGYLQGAKYGAPDQPLRLQIKPGAAPEVDELIAKVGRELDLKRPRLTGSSGDHRIGYGYDVLEGRERTVGWLMSRRAGTLTRLPGNSGTKLLYMHQGWAFGTVRPGGYSFGGIMGLLVSWEGFYLSLDDEQPQMIRRMHREGMYSEPLGPIPGKNRQLCLVRYPYHTELASWHMLGFERLISFPDGDQATYSGQSKDGTICIELRQNGFGKRRYCLWHPDKGARFFELDKLTHVPAGFDPYYACICGEQMVAVGRDQIADRACFFLLEAVKAPKRSKRERCRLHNIWHQRQAERKAARRRARKLRHKTALVSGVAAPAQAMAA